MALSDIQLKKAKPGAKLFKLSDGGAIAAPATAFLYDWNLLPIGQQLWLKWFETLKEYPPMQAPESYNLSQVLDMVKSGSGHPSD